MIKKSVAELKRQLYLGRKVTMVFHSGGAPKILNVPRQVTSVSTTGVYFNGSFLDWPKAVELTELTETRFTLTKTDWNPTLVMKYKFD